MSTVDPTGAALYSLGMATKQARITEQLDFDQLASRVEELIQLCERLQEENNRLRAQQSQLQSERTRLAEKNELSRQKVEGMVSRLKSLELEL